MLTCRRASPHLCDHDDPGEKGHQVDHDNSNVSTMAAATFSTSTSSLRASQSQAPSYNYANSTLTQLPNIDIPFEDLRKRMNEFTLRFDAFLEQGRKRVLNEHNEFKAKLSELQGERRSQDCVLGMANVFDQTTTNRRAAQLLLCHRNWHHSSTWSLASSPRSKKSRHRYRILKHVNPHSSSNEIGCDNRFNKHRGRSKVGWQLSENTRRNKTVSRL